MNDADLMTEYCDGDHRAFQALYDRVAPRLFGYLCALTRDRGVAEDVLERTFARLHATRASYVRGADPLPWLYAIAHRTLNDEARRRKRARDELPVDANGAHGAARGDDRDPELHGLVLDALSALPEGHRAALLLTTCEGMSHANAASILGTSVLALKLRIDRAHGELRALLRRDEPVESFSRRGVEPST